jgi:hypothetical protein
MDLKERNDFLAVIRNQSQVDENIAMNIRVLQDLGETLD